MPCVGPFLLSGVAPLIGSTRGQFGHDDILEMFQSVEDGLAESTGIPKSVSPEEIRGGGRPHPGPRDPRGSGRRRDRDLSRKGCYKPRPRSVPVSHLGAGPGAIFPARVDPGAGAQVIHRRRCRRRAR